MNIVSFWFSDKIALKLNHARQIKREDNPELWNIVENLSITSGLSMPKLCIMEDSSPNAFAAGAKGKRYALPNSRIMIHQGSGGFRGNAPDALIQMKEWEFLVQRNNEILSNHTGKPLEKVQRDTDRDFFMSPDEAKDYGIIDAVYTLPGESLIAQAHDAGLQGGEGSSVADPSNVGEDAPAPKKVKE